MKGSSSSVLGPSLRRLLPGLEGGRGSKGAHNRQQVLATLFHRGACSRVVLEELTGLPRSALTEICWDLERRGLVREISAVPPRGNGRGRPQTLLDLDRAGVGVISLCYGRSAIDAAVVGLDRSIRWRQVFPGPFDEGPKQLLGQLRVALKAALRHCPFNGGKLLAVGAGDPGVVERRTGRALRAANVPGWVDVPVAAALGRDAGVPIVLERAEGFEALAEVAFGAGRGARNVLYVTLTDGVGGAVVENGRLVAGRDGAAGELGHIRVAEDGPPCGCGLHGCLESYLHVTALARRWRAESGGARPGDFDSLVAAARKGETTGVRLIEEAGRKLAWVLGGTINLLNPERIVLGGRFVETGDLFLTPLRQQLPSFALPPLLEKVDVGLAELGPAAAHLGVAAEVAAMCFAHHLVEGGRPAGSADEEAAL